MVCNLKVTKQWAGNMTQWVKVFDAKPDKFYPQDIHGGNMKWHLQIDWLLLLLIYTYTYMYIYIDILVTIHINDILVNDIYIYAIKNNKKVIIWKLILDGNIAQW